MDWKSRDVVAVDGLFGWAVPIDCLQDQAA